ncbi:MAG: phosphatase PAP2 family protein [Streptosporangiaceae bacterium]
MTILILAAVLGTAVILALGAAAAARPQDVFRLGRATRDGLSVAPVLERLGWVRDQTVAGLGRLGAYAGLVAAGSAFMVAVLWPLGRVAYRLGPVDLIVYNWVGAHRSPWWTSVVQVTTQMGNKHEIWVVSAVACVCLAVLARRRSWVPVLLIATMVVLQHYAQIIVADGVDRGHPPTSHGTYPSGGVCRAFAIYGFILYVWMRHTRPWAWAAKVAAWTAIVLVAYLEAYSRVYLGQHWLLDAIGGWMFGVLILAVMIFAAGVFYRTPALATAPQRRVGSGSLSSAR